MVCDVTGPLCEREDDADMIAYPSITNKRPIAMSWVVTGWEWVRCIGSERWLAKGGAKFWLLCVCVCAFIYEGWQ